MSPGDTNFFCLVSNINIIEFLHRSDFEKMVNVYRLNILINSVFTSLSENLYGVFIVDPQYVKITGLFRSDLDESLKQNLEEIMESDIVKTSVNFQEKKQGVYTFSTQYGRIIYTKVDSESTIVFIAPLEVDVINLFPYIFLSAEKVARINLGKEISMRLPQFKIEGQKPLISSTEEQQFQLDEGDFSIKLILSGDSGVGKTTLVEQFIHEKFEKEYKSTIGVNIMSKHLRFSNWDIDINFSIYDMGGQEIFKPVRGSYYQGAKAGFIVFDVTRPETFENVKIWYNEAIKAVPNIEIILIGNKIDLVNERKITTEQGNALAKELNLKYLETCALNKDIVDEAFQTLGFSIVLKNREVNLNSNFRYEI